MAQTLAEMQAEMLARSGRVSGDQGSACITRCPHSIYIAVGDPVAYYCRLCCPSGADAVFRATAVEAPKKPRKKTKACTETVLSPN
jgi:hypothetical protein